MTGGCSAAADAGSEGDGGSGESMRGEPPVGDIPVVLDAAKRELPLAAFSLTLEEGRLLNRAESLLASRCAKRFGVTYGDPRASGAGNPGPVSLTDRRYGVADTEQAAAHGYDFGSPESKSNGTGAKEQSPAAQEGTDELDATAQTVMTGDGQAHVNGLKVPMDGCEGEAREALARTAPPSAYQNLPSALISEGFSRSKSDSRVLAVLASWSQCMKDKGFDYNDPLDAVGDPRFTTGTTRTETDTAEADVACKRSTNLVGIWFAVESAYEERLIAENRPKLEEVRRADQRRLAAARTVESRTAAP